ncbi:MAG: hypothetical protein ABSG53_23355 [Thermoguttaceae bacterium]|jgi:hypothetical protein
MAFTKKPSGTPDSGKSRSGSETRKRAPIIGFRASDEERAQIETAARRAGLTVGSYVRLRALKKPETRAVRRPPVETAQLAKLLGMLGAVGGVIARMAKRQSTENGAASEELIAAVRNFRKTAEVIILALGKHPHLSQGTHHDH